MNLSTRDLRAFIALAQERSFTRAAEQCFLSQSAFSTLIRGVEREVGTLLFDRNTRNVQLTPEGRLFEESARRLLADFERAAVDLADHAQRRRGRVAIAALPSLAADWLPALLAGFHASYPGIVMELRDTLADECLALLRAGKVDIALASAGESHDLEQTLLCEDRFYLVCRHDHPLATRRGLKLIHLREHPFVHMARSSGVRQHLDAAFHPQRMSTVIEVDHLATAAGLVEAGVGISVMPGLTLKHFAREGLVLRPLNEPALTRRVQLMHRRDASLSLAAQSMKALLLAHKPRVQVVAGTLK